MERYLSVSLCSYCILDSTPIQPSLDMGRMAKRSGEILISHLQPKTGRVVSGLVLCKVPELGAFSPAHHSSQSPAPSNDPVVASRPADGPDKPDRCQGEKHQSKHNLSSLDMRSEAAFNTGPILLLFYSSPHTTPPLPTTNLLPNFSLFL